MQTNMYYELFLSNYKKYKVLKRVKYCKLNAYRNKNKTENHSKQSKTKSPVGSKKCVDCLAGACSSHLVLGPVSELGLGPLLYPGSNGRDSLNFLPQ